MKKIWKTISLLAVISMLGTALSACGSGQKPENSAAAETDKGTADTTQSSSKAPEEMVTVTYYTWESQEENNPIWDEIREELGINVEVKLIVDDGSVNKETQLDIIQSSGADVDMRIINEASASTRIQKGFCEPLNDLIEQYDVDMEGLFGQFLKSVSYNDNYYGIPVRANMQMYFYNKDLFDAAGIAYPEDGWTWEECMDLSRKLTGGEGADKVYGYAINGAAQSFSDPAIVGGAAWYTDDNQCGIMNPLFRTSLQSMVDMDTEGIKPSYVSMRSKNSYISAEFLTGNVAIAAGQSYIIRDMKDKDNFPFDFEVGTVYPPVMNPGDNPKSVGYTAPFVAINPNSEHKEEAFRALIYYMEHGTDYISSFSIPPVANPNEDTIEALTADTPLTEADIARFFDPQMQLNRAGIPAGPGVTDYTKAVNEEIDLCLTGSQDVETTLNNIKTRADKAIAAEAGN